MHQVCACVRASAASKWRSSISARFILCTRANHTVASLARWALSRSTLMRKYRVKVDRDRDASTTARSEQQPQPPPPQQQPAESCKGYLAHRTAITGTAPAMPMKPQIEAAVLNPGPWGIGKLCKSGLGWARGGRVYVSCSTTPHASRLNRYCCCRRNQTASIKQITTKRWHRHWRSVVLGV